MGKPSSDTGMFVWKKSGPVEYFASPDWEARPFVVHAFCTRRGGVSSGRFAALNMSGREGETEANVNANWDIVAAAFGLARRQFFRVHQVHGDRIHVVDDADFPIHDRRPRECDAVVTNRPGLALCILTADCAPVLVADPARRVVAAVHAGWRGTALNISGQVVRLLRERFGSPPGELQAAIGPAIGPCCYEVDAVVRAAMDGHPDREAVFAAQPAPGKWRLDLALANRLQMEAAGIPGGNIRTAALCSSCRQDLFYSHRGAGGQTGRLLNFIMISP
ncbi:MAG: peptidoglycan editing factor PgeF [Pseudomonadota bacterium]|nr:peptidoglycan editing factor PgeF [Pseudomonadota bacterium]